MSSIDARRKVVTDFDPIPPEGAQWMTHRDDALVLLEAQLLEAQQMLERECAERQNLEARSAEMARQIAALRQKLAEAGIAPD